MLWTLLRFLMIIRDPSSPRPGSSLPRRIFLLPKDSILGGLSSRSPILLSGVPLATRLRLGGLSVRLGEGEGVGEYLTRTNSFDFFDSISRTVSVTLFLVIPTTEDSKVAVSSSYTLETFDSSLETNIDANRLIPCCSSFCDLLVISNSADIPCCSDGSFIVWYSLYDDQNAYLLSLFSTTTSCLRETSSRCWRSLDSKYPDRSRANRWMILAAEILMSLRRDTLLVTMYALFPIESKLNVFVIANTINDTTNTPLNAHKIMKNRPKIVLGKMSPNPTVSSSELTCRCGQDDFPDRV